MLGAKSWKHKCKGYKEGDLIKEESKGRSVIC